MVIGIASIINDTEAVTLLYWEDQFVKHSYYANDNNVR